MLVLKRTPGHRSDPCIRTTAAWRECSASLRPTDFLVALSSTASLVSPSTDVALPMMRAQSSMLKPWRPQLDLLPTLGGGSADEAGLRSHESTMYARHAISRPFAKPL